VLVGEYWSVWSAFVRRSLRTLTRRDYVQSFLPVSMASCWTLALTVLSLVIHAVVSAFAWMASWTCAMTR